MIKIGEKVRLKKEKWNEIINIDTTNANDDDFRLLFEGIRPWKKYTITNKYKSILKKNRILFNNKGWFDEEDFIKNNPDNEMEI